jgi:cytochrome c553
MTLRGALLVATATLLIAVVGGTPATAVQHPEENNAWNGVFTEQQAERGRTAFMASDCSMCHGFSGAFDGNTDMFPPLAGEAFMQRMTSRPIAYLSEYILENKPSDNPGSLSSGVVLDLAAFILQENGFPKGDVELTTARAALVRIAPEDWTGALPASALVRVVGCLAEGDNGDWVVTSAVAPVRFESDEIDSSAVDLDLGGASFDLRFVFTPLDEFVGHRVWVGGFLVGEAGVDGINVSRVESLSERCQ